MQLSHIIRRNLHPQPWAEGEKIPWHDPEFSQRMLREHLSQRHDAASRRSGVITRQVQWIHKTILSGKISHILDLGCGPGLYLARLAELGHTCHGIDFSPAAIDYARKQVSSAAITYSQGDMRSAEYGSGFDLVMLIFGEFNVFTRQDAFQILKKAYVALNTGGKLILELSTFDAVYEMGNQPSSWYSAEDELFADQPHLCLMESFWDDDQAAAIERYYVVDVQTAEVNAYSASTQAYEEEELIELGKQAGFRLANTYPSLTGERDRDNELFVLEFLK